MNIFKEYVKGDIKNNKKSYNLTRITIFLAVVILSTFIFSVFSYFKSYLNMPNISMGDSHFRIISTISSKDANDLISNRHIEKIGFFNIKEIEKGFGSKEKTKLFKMDNNALSIKESTLKEGSMPQSGEIMISDDMSKEIGKNIGDKIEIKGKGYYISGIFYNDVHEYQDFYSVYLNVDQEVLLNSNEELTPFIWYKNIYRTYSLSEEIMGNLETKDVNYGYNDLYLNRSFVIDPRQDLLNDYMDHILIITLFFILLILFYSIIVNLFLVQEGKSIIEYSNLKSIGATNKDIGKIINLKIMYISQIPIILGILCSLGLVKLLFMIINGVDNHFSKGKNLYSIYMHLKLKLDFRLVVFIYFVSLLIIYLASKKPIKKLKKSSILDGLSGDIKNKSYRKHDLKYTGNIEVDLSKQFYKNSKYNFRFTGITLKLGFLLMIFIMLGFTFYSMDKEYNRMSKFENYDIQGEYVTLKPLKEDFMNDIEKLQIEDLVNFRNITVNLDLDDKLIYDEYKDRGSLNSLKEKTGSPDRLTVEIFGVEDEKFKELALEKGFNPDDYIGNKAVILNTMGDNFNIPVSRMKNIKFLKDSINELSFSEYESSIEPIVDRGYEFTLNIEDKIDTPLFNYPIKSNFLNIYMPKTQYMKLVDKFAKIGDVDQYEYISVKTNNTNKIQEEIKNISLEYFREDDYFVESKLDEEISTKKRNIIGSVLAIFLSMFFVVVGFSNSYFSFYNLFLKRKNEFLLYKSIGMDKKLLSTILEQEKKKIIFSFISSMPFIMLVGIFIISKLFKIFKPIDYLLNLNYLFILVILGYVFIIYISISKMYNKHKKEIIEG